MRSIFTAAIAGVLAAIPTLVAAQSNISVIGTTSRGAVPAMATAIAKVVSSKSDMQMRTQAMSSETQYFPLLNNGKIEFAISNIFNAVFAHNGQDVYEGRPHPNFRMAITLIPFPFVVITHRDSGLETYDDLKGKRWPAGFTTQKGGLTIMNGILANAGYGWDDVKQIAVAGLPQMWDQFKQRKIDMAFAVINSANLQEIAAAVNGVHLVDWNDEPARVAAMQKALPSSFLAHAESRPMAGIDHPPVLTMMYDFVVTTHKDAPEDVVYKVLKAVYENPDELKASAGVFGSYDPDYISKEQPIPYHPGAIKLFEEKGIWPPKAK